MAPKFCISYQRMAACSEGGILSVDIHRFQEKRLCVEIYLKMVSLEYYQDAVELMATGPRPEQIVSFKPSEKLQERARELVFKEKEGTYPSKKRLSRIKSSSLTILCGLSKPVPGITFPLNEASNFCIYVVEKSLFVLTSGANIVLCMRRIFIFQAR